jgi:hypothetical protein
MLNLTLESLSQPSVWLTSTYSMLLGAVVGFFSGLVSQMFVPDLVSRLKARKALYQDLAQVFFAVDLAMNIEETEIGPQYPDKLAWRQEQIRQFPIIGEAYYKNNPAIYIQLRERFAARALYQRLQYVLEQPSTSLPVNARSLIGTFVLFVNNGGLQRKYFGRYLGHNKGKKLLSKVDDYHDRNEKSLQRLIDLAAGRDDN